MFNILGSGLVGVVLTEQINAKHPQLMLNQTRPIFAECKLSHDSVNSETRDAAEKAEGYLRLKQTFGGPLLVTGYAKHLPVSDKPYTIRVNELATDEFNDCTSTGA